MRVFNVCGIFQLSQLEFKLCTLNFEPDYIFNQSGVIPFKIENGIIKVLLITSRRTKKWIFPKGIVEPELTPQVSAEEEAYEEAGVSGLIIDEEIGSYKVDKWGGTCTVTMFPLKVDKVHEEWPESFFRKRKWLNIKQAQLLITKKEISGLLKKFPIILERNNIL